MARKTIKVGDWYTDRYFGRVKFCGKQDDRIILEDSKGGFYQPQIESMKKHRPHLRFVSN